MGTLIEWKKSVKFSLFKNSKIKKKTLNLYFYIYLAVSEIKKELLLTRVDIILSNRKKTFYNILVMAAISH